MCVLCFSAGNATHLSNCDIKSQHLIFSAIHSETSFRISFAKHLMGLAKKHLQSVPKLASNFSVWPFETIFHVCDDSTKCVEDFSSLFFTITGKQLFLKFCASIITWIYFTNFCCIVSFSFLASTSWIKIAFAFPFIFSWFGPQGLFTKPYACVVLCLCLCCVRFALYF